MVVNENPQETHLTKNKKGKIAREKWKIDKYSLIEISTFSEFSYWNLYFLFTFRIEISTFS